MVNHVPLAELVLKSPLQVVPRGASPEGGGGGG